jgi:TonB-linked SusC/RagA family outer membrane protein
MFRGLSGARAARSWRVLLTLAAILWVQPLAHGQQRFKVFSLKLSEVSVLDALRTINELSGNDVIFKKEEVEKETKTVTLFLTNVNTLEAVQTCLEGTRLACVARNNQVVVTEKTSFVITGRVTDAKGEALPGATVMIKGDLRPIAGTNTNTRGNYSLTVPASAAVLSVSFIGYISRDIPIEGRSQVDVALEENILNVSEVVVTGVFTRKAESFTGAAKTYNKEDLKLVGNGNLFQSLKNLDPTLRVIENMEMGSDPNTLPNMTIRGTSTFPGAPADVNLKGNYQSNPNQPLFIVDGFETSLETVFDMDINRIESLTILKDAASKALYGSKAANGVVVIETVGVGVDGVRLNYSGQANIEMPDLTSYNLMNAEEKLQVELLEGTIYENTPTGMTAYYERLKLVREGLDEYWLSKPLQVGVGQKHSLSFEMGTKEVRTSLELSYSDRKGIMKESFRQAISGTLTASYRKGNVLFRNIASITSNKARETPYGTFSAYARVNPYSPAYDENGEPRPTVAVGTGIEESPLADALTRQKQEQTYLEFTDNFYVEWTLLEGLRATLRGGLTTKRTDADAYYPWDHSNFKDYAREDYYKRGSYTVNNGKSTNYQVDAIVTYTQTLKERHNVFGNLTWNMASGNYIEYYNTAQGYRSASMDEYLFGSMYQEDGMPRGDGGKQRSIGVVGVFGYTYDERFLVDATLRGNGASSFGQDNRWGLFWSLGAGWNVHNERFVRDNYAFVKRLKLRGSVGYTGNQNFRPEYSQAMYEYYQTDAYNYYWSGASLSNMKNPQLKWQLKKDYDIGIDLEIGRLSVVVDWYQSDTENSVTEISLPYSNGFASFYENLGLVRNKGIELSLRASVIRHRDGFLNVHGNVATNTNKLMKLSDAMMAYNESQRALASEYNRVAPVSMYYDGMHINSIFAVPSAGIDPADGYEVYINRDGVLTKQWNALDMVNAGHADPKYNGNFGFNGEYKGFGLSAVFTFQAGARLYNNTLVNKVENASILYNMDKRALYSRWKQKGDEVSFRRIKNAYRYPVIDIRTEGSYTRATTRFVQKSNELSLSSLAVYYNVNPRWLDKLKVERLKIQANMNDIGKWSTIRIERGTSYPFARTLNISLNATF